MNFSGSVNEPPITMTDDTITAKKKENVNNMLEEIGQVTKFIDNLPTPEKHAKPDLE